MKKLMISLICILLLIVLVACGDSNSETLAQISTDTLSETGSPIASSDEAIQIVKTLFGNENDKYIFEFDNEDKISKDENGDFYINRTNELLVK